MKLLQANLGIGSQNRRVRSKTALTVFRKHLDEKRDLIRVIERIQPECSC